MLKIHNSLKREKQVFTPIDQGKVRMYVCGMTVYDYCHLGHARVMVVFDMVYRWLQASGYDVTYVRNITDIDDKIIRRAIENGETIQQLTDRFIAFMHEDADALGVLRPDHEPRATDFVPEMLDLINQLEARGLAEDVRRYGAWMREQAQQRIGHLYPRICITPELIAACARTDCAGSLFR